MFKIETPDDVTTLVRRVAEHTNLPVRIVARLCHRRSHGPDKRAGRHGRSKGQADLFDPEDRTGSAEAGRGYRRGGQTCRSACAPAFVQIAEIGELVRSKVSPAAISPASCSVSKPFRMPRSVMSREFRIENLHLLRVLQASR